jgi:hypothetical protein
MISRGQLKAKIRTVLNRSSAVKGYNTDERMEQAIEEAMDLIATEMFLAGEGWQTKYRTYDINNNQLFLPIDPDITLINEVAILVGSVTYVPLLYDELRDVSQAAPGSISTIAPFSYQIVDNKIYFSTAIADGGTDFVRIKFTAYPDEIKNDVQPLPQHFDKAMQWYIIYKSASCAAKMVGKALPEWMDTENMWHGKIIDVMNKRNNQIRHIRNFC